MSSMLQINLDVVYFGGVDLLCLCRQNNQSSFCRQALTPTAQKSYDVLIEFPMFTLSPAPYHVNRLRSIIPPP